jgi:TRAP-type mannitol/chloroaromatic compound transport system substrate-binding protein
MERREFLRGVAAGMLGGTALYLGACGAAAPEEEAADGEAAPAEGEDTEQTEGAEAPAAQTEPTVEWQMTTSWPESLDTIYGGPVEVAERVAAMTGGRFQIEVFQGGEIVPGLEVLDAVQQNTVQSGHSASYYYVGKNEALAISTALPFGFTAQQQNAWLYQGGGMELLQPLFEEFGVVAFPAGNTGAQMGGWYNIEVETVSDMQGLKFRIPGLGGRVMERIGVVTQTLPGGEIFLALDRGAIDAAEWIGPYDDEKLGLQDAADFYYYPGWWEPGPNLDAYVNINEWEQLTPEYQEIFKDACYRANINMLAKYDARNNEALQRLIEGGTELRPYSDEIMAAAQTAAFELYEELASADERFNDIFTEWLAFRERIYNWHQTNENSFTTFVYNNPVS